MAGGFSSRRRAGDRIKADMRSRTKIKIPNPSKSEFENFDRFVRIVLAKGKPAKEAKPKVKARKRRAVR